MVDYVIVGLAGIVGALLRYYLGLLVSGWWNGSFPLATLLANMIGCFALGCLNASLSRLRNIPSYVATGLGTGLVGSFTTFSTFSVETVELLRTSHWGTALVYVFLSMCGGLLMAWCGFRLGRNGLRVQNKVAK
ncbi:fluoride efflux transporter CrcB [Parageobacillus thermoglucosidasius]|uniref:Fluoride-specific ion channel FluC n=1 Tax=Parageobacillus thermoglucosidasius TaxID=1426 RepID=A0A1B7KU28_PARTM|nr:fluoride efflux transporter CrcB [Parageobacillus thermoglucosidasius]OAT73600.1 camphor resistance protein CrcB [Parageobacillus thermoglucosidasius]